MRDDRALLVDVCEAIQNVEKYASHGRAQFERDELIRIWIVHHIQVIGEAAQRLSDQLRGSHPEVPWKQIAAMRNILVHHYFKIDFDEVWSVVEKDIPVLKPQIQAMLNSLDKNP